MNVKMKCHLSMRGELFTSWLTLYFAEQEHY